MEYNGDLYGKVGGMVFKTGKTSKDWDDMEARLKKLEAENLALKKANGVNSDSKALHIDSVSIRTCSDALYTIIKWNEYDKNGTDNRAPHKDECIGVICKATLETLKGYGC